LSAKFTVWILWFIICLGFRIYNLEFEKSMPELPEVQTIVDDLNRKIRGKTVVDFLTDWPKTIKYPVLKFRKEIVGKKILNIQRRGKNLLFFLDNGKVMLVHLKMTGHLLVKSSQSINQKAGKDYFSDKVNQYIHHIWHLREKTGGKAGVILEFSDLRKFGKIMLIDKDEIEKVKDISALGPDPLSGEFTLAKLKEVLLKKKNIPIRNILMDQSLIAGIGNIYVSEILFDAGVSPKSSAKDVLKNGQKAGRLFKSIKKILKKAVKLRGTSDSDYRDTNGAPGGFQLFLKVYRKEGRPCPRQGCTGVIRREKAAGRSSFWCPKCQR